jgi:hypothetical protein
MQDPSLGSVHSLTALSTAYAVTQCPDGHQGRLIAWQPGAESKSPTIHLVDCSNRPKSSNTVLGQLSPSITRSFTSRIHPRQTPMCEDPCTTTCYTSNIQYNANDCDALSNWMWERGEFLKYCCVMVMFIQVGGQFPINAGERVVMTWGTCMYTFTNERFDPVTWCDAQWVCLLFLDQWHRRC